MLGLIVLSWLKVNLKKKTKNGHCYNPTHTPTAITTKPANCPVGSIFRKELYDDFTNILEDFLGMVKDCKPTPIKSKIDNIQSSHLYAASKRSKTIYQN